MRGLVRAVVTDAAPGELPFVAAMNGLSDAAVSHRLARGKKQRDPLGFGIGEAVVLATPIVWTAVQAVAVRVTDSFTDSLLQRARDAFRRLARRPRRPAPLPRFDDGQRAEIHRLILQKASQGGLDTGFATLIADSVVGHLALAASADQRPQAS